MGKTFLILVFLSILAFSILPVKADTTFFDQNDAFIMGSSGQSLGQTSDVSSSVSSDDGKGNSKKEPANDTSDSDEENAPTQGLDGGNKTKGKNNIKSETPDYNYLEEVSTRYWNYLLFFVLFALFFSVCFGIFKYPNKIKHLIKKDLRIMDDNNTVKVLINKEVYTHIGDYIGRIKEIILERNKIHSIKIELDKKHKFGIKGIICKYVYIKGIGQIVIMDSRIIETLKNKNK